jgi:hypothetical protein
MTEQSKVTVPSTIGGSSNGGGNNANNNNANGNENIQGRRGNDHILEGQQRWTKEIGHP